jgi:N-acetyl-anhydromuramyl-L-alanine amidase AmpD
MSEPRVVWAGTAGHNFWAGRAGQAPVAIVNHVMLGTLGGTATAFASPAHEASAHYGIGQDGTIFQFVRDEDTAWANGPIRNPNLAAVPWLAECVAHNINPNRRTISLEWEGTHQGGAWRLLPWAGATLETLLRGSVKRWWAPTAAQYAAGVWLHQQLIARHHIARDRAHICRHSDFDAVSKWFCPGPGFPMAALIADLGGHL